MRRRNALSAAVVVWLLVTCGYAVFYVRSVLSSGVLYGYEGEWTTQLFFFSLVRLPWLVALLVVVVAFILKSKRFR
jgi:hypothetical protein